MKNKITLFFAALMMTLGVCAQEGSTVEQRGAEKGYYPFAAEITGMEKLTSLNQIEDNMEIMIERDGSYLTIYSLPSYGAAHIVFMQNKPVGVGVWTTKTVDANAGTFQLKSAHMMITDADDTCYLGQLELNKQDWTYLRTTGNTSYVGTYKFVPATDGSGRWNLQCTNNKNQTYLSIENTNGNPTITEASSVTNQTYFNVYKVTSKSTAKVKYVEADVHLTGPSGNVISLEHQGWNDFYEFIMNNQAFKCTMTNTQYDESRNLITADMTYPFAVSGNAVKIPMYIHADKNATKRVIVDGNTIKVVNKDDITAKNEANSQWYLFPKVIWGKYYDANETYANAPEAYKVVYAIQNVGTGKFINYTTYTEPFTLGDDIIYFDCTGSLTDTYFRFKFEYTTSTTSTFLHNNSNVIKPLYLSGNADCNFYLSKVPTPVEDLGFVQYIPYGTSFWNRGRVTDGYPDSFKADNYWNDNDLHEGANPDNKWNNHYLYCAETTVEVNALSDIVASFEHTGGINRLQIFGVDIVGQTAEGYSYSERDYHLGYAGVNPQNYIYTLRNVPPGNYTLRYWVCHADGHNLNHFQGKVTVTGANLRFKASEAPNSEWAQNTTWYTFNLGNQYNNYLDAQPAYTDVQDNLQLTNATLPTDAAALWCFVGNETDGYKIYNRAWGPGYVLATTGEGANARTTMMSEEEASRFGVYSRYDVMLKKHNDHGAWFIRLHGTNTTFLMKQSDYLAVQNSTSTYDAHDAVFNVHEVMLTDSYDTQLTDVVMGQILSAYWTPWTANSDITSAPTDFVSLVKGRIAAAQALHGKAFKFVSKSTTGNRTNKVLSLNGDNKIAGIDATKKVYDFMLLLHNGDGTMSLYHMATGQCFGLPSDATTTDEASATPYTFMMKKDEANTVTFVTGNQMMHLQNSGSSETFEITNYNDLNDDASRWSVVFDTEAQQLADSIMKARAKYAEVNLDAYKANVGVPGYVANTHESVINLPVEVKSLDELTIEEAKAKISSALKAIATEESRVFFPTDCYFTITNKNNRGSVVYDETQNAGDSRHNGAKYLWATEQLDATNPNHIWGFYQDEETGEYYLYNVGKIQFANSRGKGGYALDPGYTWIFSNSPVAITMEALETPYFHIKGADMTMSVSNSYTGPVITYYEDGDEGVPFEFNKSSVPFDEDILNKIKALNQLQLKPGFYMFKYDENLYLNDKPNTEKNAVLRTVTPLTDSKIENIFYYTDDNALVGYATGFGFVYGQCNTGNVEDGYNRFTFETSSEDGKVLVRASEGESPKEWADRYITYDSQNKTLKENGDKNLASAWTIEDVAELPVKLTTVKNETGAYGTIWSPVALEIPEGVTAYTGYVTSECELVLEAITGGVIPAETGVVLWNEKAEKTYVQNLKITDAATTAVSGDNKFVGWVMTKANPNTEDGDYYSLGKNGDNMAFYRYIGPNLQGFRARIEKSDAPANASALTMRFANPTSIEEVVSAFQNNAVYDLNGRRVATPEKGIYIVNGKKVIIK